MNFLKNNFYVILAALTGAVIFILIYGINVLNPCFTGWIFTNEAIDLPQHYIGWEFFRNTDWQFPLGLFNTLSYPVNTSIINMDAIPIFAVFFKMFSGILPETFQYLGFFGLICYILQCALGTVISKKFTNNNFLALLGGILFTLMPIFQRRMFSHTALASHWLILLCLLPILFNKELSFKKKLTIYIIAGVFTAGFHVYLIAICGIIVLVHTLYCLFVNKQIKVLLYLVVYSVSSVFTLWLLGIFSMNTLATTDKESLFYYSANLNTFFNPKYVGQLYPALKNYEDVFEGVGYFGVGILLLILLVLISFLVNKFKKIKTEKSDNKDINLQLWILIILSFILASSPQVTFGDKVLFIIPYPEWLIHIWSTIMSTGRFVFVTDYVVLTLILAYLFKNFKLKTLVCLLVLSIIIQTADLYNNLLWHHNNGKLDRVYINKLNDGKYDNIFKSVKLIYPVFDNWENLRYLYDLSQYSFERNILLSNFYFSREIEHYKERVEENIKDVKSDEVFIFTEEELQNYLAKENNLKYFYKTDNFIYAKTVPAEGLDDYIYPINQE